MDICGVSAESANVGTCALCKSSAHGPSRCECEPIPGLLGAGFRHFADHLPMEACGQYRLRAIFLLDGSTGGLTSFWFECRLSPLMPGRRCLGVLANDDAALGRSYPGGHGDGYHWRRGQASQCVGTGISWLVKYRAIARRQILPAPERTLFSAAVALRRTFHPLPAAGNAGRRARSKWAAEASPTRL